MARLRELFAKRDDPYAGVDLANAARFGAALWFLGAVLTALMLPFVPPDEQGGEVGWIVGALVIVGCVVAGLQMRRAGSQLNVDLLYVYSYAAVAAVTTLVWLSGGKDSPYAQLFILSAAYTCAIHPPRRVLAYLGVFIVLALSPLAYADFSDREVVDHIFHVFMWLLIALLVMVLMAVVRSQRLGLRIEGDRARRQARVDPLTGLLNRRAFDEALAAAVDRAQTGHAPLCLLVGDIDGFKDFNDRFGHLEGDRVLRSVADSLRSALRRPDAAYRWGGDEFAVLLPEADLRGAELVAERIQAAVRRTVGPDGEPISMATGVAELDPTEPHASETLLVGADSDLMRAKGSGSFEIPRTQG